jgi:hypothetical protein
VANARKESKKKQIPHRHSQQSLCPLAAGGATGFGMTKVRTLKDKQPKLGFGGEKAAAGLPHSKKKSRLSAGTPA